MISVGEIYARYSQRQQDRSPLVRKWADVRDTYNSELAVPLPELSAKEKPAVPNLLAQGVDQMAMRIASTPPDITYPPVRPNIQASINKAADRRKANLAWWTTNRMGLALRRRARHHVAYGMTVVQIEPDFDNKVPRWRIRNPLTAYPATISDPEQIQPTDCIFATSNSAAEITAKYPNLARLGAFDAPGWGSQRWTMLEYEDANETVSAVVGPAVSDNYMAVFSGLGKQVLTIAPMTMGKRGQVDSYGTAVFELERVPNRTEMCRIVTPGRITLDRVAGMFESMIGMYEMSARLMALDVIAVEQAIYPDLWFIEGANQTGDIEIQADGRSGKIGRVTGGTLEPINLQPGAQTGVTLDRLERAMRVNTNTPPQWSGESSTNIRTGRLSDSILSATVDYHIQEAQDTFAASLELENRLAVATVQAYWPNTPVSFTVNWPKVKKGTRADYTPADIFTESDTNSVDFPHPGADVNSLTVGLGQMIGLGLISNHSAAKKHPMIDDADYEHEQITFEQLEKAVLSSVQQGASTGQWDPTDVAFVASYVRDGKGDLFDAINKAHQRAQARQAAAGPVGSPEGPVPPGSPEAQPGLASGSPAAAGAVQPAIAPPSPSISNAADLIRRLATGSRGGGGPTAATPAQAPLVPSGSAPARG